MDIDKPGEGASVKSLKGLVFDTKRVWTFQDLHDPVLLGSITYTNVRQNDTPGRR